MSWLDRVFLARRILSDVQADVALVLTSQVEILARLKGLQKMTVVVTDDTERAGAIAELWRLRDALSTSDPDLAAQLHSIYNKLVVAHPQRPDAG